jgi:uncharacterized FlaG/YvyC family protein
MDIAPVGNPGQTLAAVPGAASPNWLVENRDLISTVKGINAPEIFGEGSELTFALDRSTARPVVRVVNRQSGEVLWQAPPEYMLRLAQTLGHQDG